MKILRIIIALALCNQIFAQETFPVNGVAETFKPIYAFTNANIISTYLVYSTKSLIELLTLWLEESRHRNIAIKVHFCTFIAMMQFTSRG